MSDPGLTPDQYSQLQDLQRRQAMAASLMNSNPGQQNAAYGGLANVGSMLLGATMADKNRTDQQNLLNHMRYDTTPNQPVSLPAAVGANGSKIDLGTINAKTPLIQQKGSNMLSNLFNFGGG